MTTALDWCLEAESHILSNWRESRNVLAAAVLVGTASPITLEFDFDLGAIAPGTMLSIDLERFRVWSVDAGAKTAVCERAQDGTVAAAHADRALVYVNPVVDHFAALRAINAELADLSAPENGLYRTRTVDLTYNAAVVGYDLTGVTAATAPIGDPLRVAYKIPGSSKYTPRNYRYRLDSNANTTDFPSGYALFVNEGSPGLAVRVVYRSPFTAMTALADDVTTTGVPTPAYDIPPLGAAIRLILDREVKRTFTEAQGDTRRAEEVPAGATQASARGLMLLRQRRIAAEASRLYGDHELVLNR